MRYNCLKWCLDRLQCYNSTRCKNLKWANANVTKDVEPYAIVWWNPAKVIRYRFDKETIDFLENLKWWDWEIDKITANLDAIIWTDLEKLKKLA